MFKNKFLRRIALLLSLIILLTSTVNTTFGFIVTKTDSLINTFIPFVSVMNRVNINKTVEHPFGEQYIIPDDISFDFKIDLGSLYSNTTIKTTLGDIVADKNGSIIVQIKPGKSFCLENIDSGTKVTVTELQKDGIGFSVKDGVTTKECIVPENGELNIDFVNVYSPADVKPINVTVKGTKVLEGREWHNGDSFTFKIEKETNENAWETLGEKTVAYTENNPDFNAFDMSDLIQNLSFGQIGTYRFRITEIIGNLNEIDYDKSVNTFSIKVTDTDMDGCLEINTVTAAQNAQVTETNDQYLVSVIFNNKFVPAVPSPEDISVNITVNKTVKNKGDSSIGPDGFEFTLKNTADGQKSTLLSDSNGKAVFRVNFTAADVGKTYNYTLSETNNGRKGITYDTSVYNISVTVSQDQENNLVAVTTVNGSAVETVIAEFENIYSAKAPTTGDNSNITLWFILMIVSGAATIMLIFLDKRYSGLNKNTN